jgi:Sulfotransferase family
VIYIMGAGHSGSTILGVTLGNCAGVFYAGEVEEWLVNSGAPHLGGSERSRFWSAVREDIEDADELHGGEVNRCLERSSAVFRVDRWPARFRLRGRYRRFTEDLYQAIARAASVTHVVDSSHFPLRARELKALRGIDLYLVFLVRNPQSVVASNLRPLSRREVSERRLRILSTNASLWLTHLLSVIVFLGHPRRKRLFLRYEDFVANPQQALRQILDGIDCSAEVPDLTALRTGVPLLGNKLIRSEVVALTDPGSSTVPRSRLTALLHLPWAPVFSRMQPALTAVVQPEQPSTHEPR